MAREKNWDTKPFTKADSFFADAKFFEESGVSNELLPSVVPSTGERNKKEKWEINRSTPETKPQTAIRARGEAHVTTPVQKARPTPEKTLHILRYIPKSYRKAGEGPFQDYQSPEMKPANEIKGERLLFPCLIQTWHKSTLFSNPLRSKALKEDLIPTPISWWESQGMISKIRLHMEK